MKPLTVRDMTEIAIVAALYIILTVTPPFSLISYGAYQFRISEMLNFLVFYNPKYLIAVTIGCMISNYLSFSTIDVVVGGGSTLIFVGLGYYLFKKYMTERITFFKGFSYNKAFLYFSFFFAASMFTIALEMNLLQGMPFFYTWFTLFVGELASLLVGSYLIEKLVVAMRKHGIKFI